MSDVTHEELNAWAGLLAAVEPMTEPACWDDLAALQRAVRVLFARVARVQAVRFRVILQQGGGDEPETD